MAEVREEWGLKRGQYLGEISALCFLPMPSHLSSFPFLLAGTGSELLLYNLETGELIKSFQVFEGIRVHGIFCCIINSKGGGSSSSLLAFSIAVFGERRVKLFSLCIEMDFKSINHSEEGIRFTLSNSLPKLRHWVLDVCFMKEHVSSSHERSHCLAVGCSDNSLCFWDTLKSNVVFEVPSPEKCLLYSMRIWGDEVEALRIASGTIYNEIIVWKVAPQKHAKLRCPLEDREDIIISLSDGFQLHDLHYEAVQMCRLVGHEGSIFRIAWNGDGSKLVSVSDDRSARIWEVHAEAEGVDNHVGVVGSHSPESVLFGHSARVWDCFTSGSLIITAGEDCTCRVWGPDGSQLKMIKEHIGRGIWRCLYDPHSSLLVTAGFDSGIKVHHLHGSLSNGLQECAEGVKDFTDRAEIFTIRTPRSSKHIGLTDSKSEYVRCLHFTCEDSLYVATNNGYLYHSKLSDTSNVKWTELVQVGEKVPIVCMDLLSRSSSDPCGSNEDWIAVGDGKGSLTIVRVIGDVSAPAVGLTFTWSAGIERQLLGAYWCKSLGTGFIFTADPKGTLKLWRLCDPLQSGLDVKSYHVSLIAEFVSCFGMRIMCVDASVKEEVMVCGDVRGNLILFPLLNDLLLGKTVASEVKIHPLKYFKGAHGISTVCSIAIARFSSSQIEVHSTGGDSCICYLLYDRDRQVLEFLGMKQVKELSSVQSVSHARPCDDSSRSNYAVGFASANFIIWNLVSETKIVEIPCGGWRRPHSYYFGDVPEMKNCFAFVKDEVIYVHRYWIPDYEKKMHPQNLHLQFHGREMHSLCFIAGDSQFDSAGKQDLFSKSSWIATGCEDGTVRLTRYDLGVERWSVSKLLGEHVGGSAVRSICFVSKIHTLAADVTSMPNGINERNVASEDAGNPSLLISVGAKRVLTSWKQRNNLKDVVEEEGGGPDNGTGYRFKPSSKEFPSMSFQWLSTDMPNKYCSTRQIREKSESKVGASEYVSASGVNSDLPSGSSLPGNTKMMASKSSREDNFENDWRYLAVTAFLVKVANSRLTICFIVVACSDATLTLRALVIPYQLWFDVALLVPLSSPVLALQHVIIPACLPSEDNVHTGSVYIVISGSTDGSITFWDLTESVETFVRRMPVLQIEKSLDGQERPRTGRGSQGGRWWRTSRSNVSKREPEDKTVTANPMEGTRETMLDNVGISAKNTEPGKSTTACSQAICSSLLQSEVNTDDSSLRICITPMHVLNNIHQSGVNCLHVSDIKDARHSAFDFSFYVLSGGDDQAISCLGFELALLPLTPKERGFSNLGSTEKLIHCCHIQNFRIQFLYHDKLASAHGSAVKGIWTDGRWVFSTGLDQRIRCWHFEEHGELTERANLIISVPEPEALDTRACGRNYYQIAVAGRGMQIVEFSASCGKHVGH